MCVYVCMNVYSFVYECLCMYGRIPVSVCVFASVVQACISTCVLGKRFGVHASLG